MTQTNLHFPLTGIDGEVLCNWNMQANSFRSDVNIFLSF